MIRSVFFLYLLAGWLVWQPLHARTVYRSVLSGEWTRLSTWQVDTGSGWMPATVAPNHPAANVIIQTGHVVTARNVVADIFNLRVESGAKLYTSSSNSFFCVLTIWGDSIVCDGSIGNLPTADGLICNFESNNCLISGAGSFGAARFKKENATNPVTNLTIRMNVSLFWDGKVQNGVNTVMYNNCHNSFFNVSIDSGYTLSCRGGSTFPANVSIDHQRGSGTGNPGGVYLVSGTLVADGILFASTDNNDTAYCSRFVIENGGLIQAAQISSSGGNGNSRVYFTVKDRGKLELTGRNGLAIDLFNEWGRMHNFYDFQPGSTVEYSAQDPQSVLVYSDFNNSRPAYQSKYWNLVLSGSGVKTARNDTLFVRGNLIIKDNAVLNQEVFDRPIEIGGNWMNQVGASAFVESTEDTCYVKFTGCGALPTTSEQTISCPGGEVFHHLWIAKDSSDGINDRVSLLTPVTINHRLTLGENQRYGILSLNGRQLTIENPDVSAVTLQGAVNTADHRRFIVSEDPLHGGMFRWWIGTTVAPGSTGFPYTIPFGIATNKDTIPFGFYKDTTADLGYLTIATYSTPPDNQPWPISPVLVSNLNSQFSANNLPDNRDWTVDRFWYIGADHPTGNCGVRFNYNNTNGTELPAADPFPQNIRAQFWETTGGTWHVQQFGSGSVAPEHTVSVNDLPVFNTEWTLSSLASPLPIELLVFDVSWKNTDALVEWSTASEIENDYFTIERGRDGITFEPIGSVVGAGTSSLTNQYRFFDHSPLDGRSYYRLRQTDFDGRSSYSEVRSLFRSGNGTSSFSIYPNPTGGIAFLSAPEDVRGPFSISITDMSGRVVLSQTETAGTALLDLSSLASGSYQLSILSEGRSDRLRLMIEKK